MTPNKRRPTVNTSAARVRAWAMDHVPLWCGVASPGLGLCRENLKVRVGKGVRNTVNHQCCLRGASRTHSAVFTYVCNISQETQPSFSRKYKQWAVGTRGKRIVCSGPAALEPWIPGVSTARPGERGLLGGRKSGCPKRPCSPPSLPHSWGLLPSSMASGRRESLRLVWPSNSVHDILAPVCNERPESL